MNIKAILAAAAMVTSLAACTNDNNSEEGSESTTGVQQQTTTDNYAAEAPPSAPGLPSFALQNVNGEAVNLQSFKGKKVFVNLWASWCPPCRAEMPSIQKLAHTVDTNKVAFVMLALDDDFKKSINFVQKQKIALPVYYPVGTLPALFNVQGIPTTFIFNERGELMQRIDGGDDYDTKKYRDLLK